MSHSNVSTVEMTYPPLEQELLDKVKVMVESYKNTPGALILVLQEAQTICGYLPFEVQQTIADILKITAAEVYSVVSFYSFFTMQPRGKTVIRVCTGTACFVCGADKIIGNLEQLLGMKSGETTPDMKYTLEEVRCLGACGLAPVVTVNAETYGCLEPAKVAKILEPQAE